MSDVLVMERVERAFNKKGNQVQAVTGIDLRIKRGDFIAIQGPSGSGKTTLLNLLGCLDRVTSGKIVLGKQDITYLDETELSTIRAKRIGFIFQDFNLIPIFTALENVELPMIANRTPRSERRSKAMVLLRRVGLGKRMNHRPDELSAGEQQRVAIARALANDPSIILADEPTGNLDTANGKLIMDLLGQLNKELGTTIVIVTHDDRMAQMTKKRIYLKDGRIVQTEDTKPGLGPHLPGPSPAIETLPQLKKGRAQSPDLGGK